MRQNAGTLRSTKPKPEARLCGPMAQVWCYVTCVIGSEGEGRGSRAKPASATPVQPSQSEHPAGKTNDRSAASRHTQSKPNQFRRPFRQRTESAPEPLPIPVRQRNRLAARPGPRRRPAAESRSPRDLVASRSASAPGSCSRSPSPSHELRVPWSRAGPPGVPGRRLVAGGCGARPGPFHCPEVLTGMAWPCSRTFRSTLRTSSRVARPRAFERPEVELPSARTLPARRSGPRLRPALIATSYAAPKGELHTGQRRGARLGSALPGPHPARRRSS